MSNFLDAPVVQVKEADNTVPDIAFTHEFEQAEFLGIEQSLNGCGASGPPAPIEDRYILAVGAVTFDREVIDKKRSRLPKRNFIWGVEYSAKKKSLNPPMDLGFVPIHDVKLDTRGTHAVN